MRSLSFTLLALGVLWACAEGSPPKAPEARAPARAPTPADKVISVVGTNDLHGHVEHLDAFAGYVARLRELRKADGGVLLVDAGDMFQGTLESNLGEGAAVIAAFNALGYSAAALGNHEFDFGPAGSAEPVAGADPQGALRARLIEARFPVLAANLIDTRTGRIPGWRNLHASVMVEVSGVKLGLVGVLTDETPRIVMPAYFTGLDVGPLAAAITREAANLRARGARAVIVLAHAGGVCQRFDDPRSETACEADQELNRLARQLPTGSVDAIIGGHSHAGVAHVFSGIAVAEAYAYCRAFSRIDLRVPGDAERSVTGELFPPRQICADAEAPVCVPGTYEGVVIGKDPRISASVAAWRDAAASRRAEKLGVRVTRAVRQDYAAESPLGNLYADLLLAAVPGSDVAIVNGGGLRAPLPAGELTYGQLYESQPFDNLVTRLELTGAELGRVIAAHLERERHGIISIAGARVGARCAGGRLVVSLTRKNGKPIGDAERLTIVTSDYLATGGDELFAGPGRPAPRVDTATETVRDALAGALRKRGGSLDGEDSKLLDPKQPRLSLPAPRPIRCPG